ncbi:plus-3-domain-containing protein [Metschnikowia bicuspidata var. bicuspidata NRRL YB-4993]|uniref:Plus-3-domain-containing protein n=1 Tax=Metschnikowia bicuspidata var. bicuspidata NRRL YB-4993 TaxID=869754 RepID=A0A1A0H9W6_9ASCO|nr:plus-3-domain-containing protein [Metschnikowia bicuspidata var. bicuspidata NRRL YB-4993]OBA20668.1 plus-3-domain-containing protein [Metschnikowia bicuspidata var. bicuspidata NRRL YB-4993]
MSDLDDDLLALAGADSGSEHEVLDVPSKQHSAEDSAEDGEFDPEVDVEFGSRGAEDTAQNGADSSDEGAPLANPYPLEGKYRDEADRARLLAMDEVEREQALFERSQEMDRYTEKTYLQQRMRQQKTQGVEPKTRALSRKTGVPTAKTDTLSELRKQREQRTRRREDDYEDDDDAGAEDDSEQDAGFSDASADAADGVVWGAGALQHRPRTYVRATAADINKIRVGRSFLGKFLYYKEFAEAVAHTFGKINVGVDRRTRQPMYRAVQIEEVVLHPHKQYRMGDGKTDMYLLVSQNNAQKKEFPLSVFSDADITPDEFARYAAELAKLNEEVPYVDDVNEKAEQLHRLMNSGLSNKDIDEMVSRRQKLLKGITAYDAVYQKSKVLDELKVARQENNTARVKELTAQLNTLEQVLYKDNARSSQSSSTSMSKVNERNRKLNQTNIRKAEVKSSFLRKTTDLSDGDPFSRLKTTTRIFYQELVNEENQKALQDAQANFESRIAEKSEQEAKIASSKYRVLGNFDKLIAQVDIDFSPRL